MADFIILAAVIVVVALICVFCSQRAEQDFYQRFPPISDEEFVARCGPGRNVKVALKVRRILADCLNVEYERIYPSSRLSADLLAE
jgi:hypothetical protein